MARPLAPVQSGKRRFFFLSLRLLARSSHTRIERLFQTIRMGSILVPTPLSHGMPPNGLRKILSKGMLTTQYRYRPLTNDEKRLAENIPIEAAVTERIAVHKKP